MSLQLATIHCDVPVPFELAELKVREPDVETLKKIYKELEFFSHLKELGPSEDVRPRDFAALETADTVGAFVASVPEGAALAIALSSDLTEFGLARRPSEARSLPLSRLGELRPALENADLPKAASDLKSLMLSLLKRGIHAQGLRDDVSLYAFLLDADPGGCSLEALVERRLDLRPGPRADERASFVYELNERLRPNELARLSVLMEAGIACLTSETHALAGREFNISSPQQLGKVLFEEMRLPAPVKGA
jgi:DNA polymerase-1